MNKDMSSWQCLTRYNLIDTFWFHYVYLILLVILFAHKKRFIAVIFAISCIVLTIVSISGCMSSIGAFTSIALTHMIIIVLSVILLFVLSFVDFGNIYATCGIYIVLIYIFFIYGLFFRIMDWVFPSPVQVISIGNVDVRNKSPEEVNRLLKEAIVPV